MNLFVADPHWGWWIIGYFFLGGIAAGAYFTATLIDLFGAPADRGLSRVGYWIAFPLIAVCGVFLILDLNRPERFWHMLLDATVVHEARSQGWPSSRDGWSVMSQAPHMKYWSPMSVGSWALSLFGLCSFVSFWNSLRPKGRLARWLSGRPIELSFAIVGCLSGFFVAAYTGALLTATNQPIWSDSVFIAPLFLSSSASTGIAAIILLTRWRNVASPEALDRLERADRWALAVELAVFAIFLASLEEFLPPLLRTNHGLLFVCGTLVVGLLIPLSIHSRLGSALRSRAVAVAIFTLAGGFILRYGLLTAPPELLQRGATTVAELSAR